jgi:hypothetical protein
MNHEQANVRTLPSRILGSASNIEGRLDPNEAITVHHDLTSARPAEPGPRVAKAGLNLGGVTVYSDEDFSWFYSASSLEF